MCHYKIIIYDKGKNYLRIVIAKDDYDLHYIIIL